MRMCCYKALHRTLFAVIGEQVLRKNILHLWMHMSLRFLNDKKVYEQRINGLPVLFQLKVNKDKVAIS